MTHQHTEAKDHFP